MVFYRIDKPLHCHAGCARCLQALKLLHRLATDPGINGIMERHGWRVGLLSEMPPAGKVGISPVCILGVNVNKGQEISLRLRTDDLKGFRQYLRIRETLIHELAHMVHGDHDDAFKALNSALKTECSQLDWVRAAAPRVAREAARPETLSQHDAANSVQPAKAGGIMVGGSAPQPGLSAAAAAGAAAAQRAAHELDDRQQPAAKQQAPPFIFAKGESVLYRTREGPWVPAVVAAVDKSVVPWSYGIELNGGYRETEGDRLGRAGAGGLESVVEGLGHHDAATEEREQAVKEQLEC
jgi:hypothetical protein